jgi:diacylglycerol kinase (ATP)
MASPGPDPLDAPEPGSAPRAAERPASLAPPPPARRPGGPVRAFLRSFAFAWTGLAEAAVRDRNLRIHLALGVLAGAFAAVVPLAGAERAVLLVCIAAVIAAEAANTAVEAIVDLVSPQWSERARIAKDAAAASVLVLAAGSVLAFAAIVAARWDVLVADAPRLWAPAWSAAIVAVAAGLLPWRGRGGNALDVLVAACAAALGLEVARHAVSLAGVAAMAACLAVSISAAWRKRRLA